MDMMMQKPTRIALVVDKDEATHRALSRIGESQGFIVSGFLEHQDFIDWFDDQCAYPTVSNFNCCFILDVGLMYLIKGGKLPGALYDIPKIYIGSPHFSCELSKLASMGFFDFLEKPFSMKRIGECVDAAFMHHGKILNGVQQVLARHARLSKREFEVGMLVVTGITNLEIGEKLNISIKTVKAHRAKVMKKTESASLVELVRFFDSYLSLSESDSSMR